MSPVLEHDSFFFPFIWVTVIAKFLFQVCATVPAQGPGVRESYVRLLGESWVPSDLQIEQNLFAACQHTTTEWAMMKLSST